MASVTQRIEKVKQPYGGYLPRKDFSVEEYDDGLVLGEENITPGIVGLAVDYMTRYMLSGDVKEAFKISYMGAHRLDFYNENNKATKMADRLMSEIDGLNDESIINACKLAGFDVCLRAGIERYKPVEDISPDKRTIDNIAIMVNRSLAFMDKYGPIVKDGFTFEGGYTPIIDSGDGDFITKDTLWDFKVSKKEPNSKQTLQLLIYYLMGKHSVHSFFNSITKLGIYNPRLNKVYTYNLESLSQEIIDEVCAEVIGYGAAKTKSTTNSTSITSSKISSDEEDAFTLKEVADRYGISSSKVSKDLIPRGLPYYKKGNAYRFNKDKLLAWEIVVKRIPYGRNGYIELPGYIAYSKYLKEKLREAKKNKDKDAIKEIKQMMKEADIKPDLGFWPGTILFIFIVGTLLGLFWLWLSNYM